MFRMWPGIQWQCHRKCRGRKKSRERSSCLSHKSDRFSSSYCACLHIICFSSPLYCGHHHHHHVNLHFQMFLVLLHRSIRCHSSNFQLKRFLTHSSLCWNKSNPTKQTSIITDTPKPMKVIQAEPGEIKPTRLNQSLHNLQRLSSKNKLLEKLFERPM